MTYDDRLTIEPYSLDSKEKESLLTERLVELTERHVKTCPEYADMLRLMSYDKGKVNSYKELPFLPVRLFKDLSLKSVPDEEEVKTMTSSGTTGQQVSKIYLDRTTASNQQKTMVKIVSAFTGSERMPMIILDCPCGRKGKYFKITGRIKSAEIRGCSDTFAADRGGFCNCKNRDFMVLTELRRLVIPWILTSNGTDMISSKS